MSRLCSRKQVLKESTEFSVECTFHVGYVHRERLCVIFRCGLEGDQLTHHYRYLYYVNGRHYDRYCY